MRESAAQHMVKYDASIYCFYIHLLMPPSRAHLPLFRILTPSLLPKSVRPMPKINLAVATESVADDSPVCFHDLH